MFSLPFFTERSIEINASLDEVFAKVSDFNNWRVWSPWLCQEPECPVTITGEPASIGHYQKWEGKRIGHVK